MAITTERLIATLEMRMDKYDKALKKAQGDTTRAFSAITSSGDRLENRLSTVGARGTKGLDNVTRSARALQGQTGNLAAQFNDIGVQLAGGQSPFLIAIQQGTQINQVLGQAGALGAARALGGALTSLINPVSLLTIGIIALGGTAVQYFVQMLSDGEDAEKTLEEQAQLIQQVADKWGAALPALQAYADERRALADLEKVNDATQAVVADIWAPVRDRVQEARLEIADLVISLQQAGAEQDSIVELQRAFEDLRGNVDDGTASTEDMERVAASLTSLFNQTSIPVVSDLAGVFSTLASEISAASAEAARFQEQQAALNAQALFDKNIKDSVLPKLDPLGFIDPMRDQNNRANATESLTQRAARLDGLRGGAKRGGGGGRSSRISDAQREQEAIAKLVETLEFEQSLIGATDVEREKANALRRAGAGATEEQRARIVSLIEAINAEEAALRSSEEAMRELNDVGREVLGGIISDMRQGKNAAEALAGALDRVADKLLDGALDALFGGGKGGGGFGGILSSIFGGFRAGGGPVSAGKAYVVGEKGPEIIVPNAAGTVIPNDAARGGGGGTQGIHVTVGVDVDKSGNLTPFVTSISDQRSQVWSQQAMQQSARQFPQAQQDRQRRTG